MVAIATIMKYTAAFQRDISVGSRSGLTMAGRRSRCSGLKRRITRPRCSISVSNSPGVRYKIQGFFLSVGVKRTRRDFEKFKYPSLCGVVIDLYVIMAVGSEISIMPMLYASVPRRLASGALYLPCRGFGVSMKINIRIDTKNVLSAVGIRPL